MTTEYNKATNKFSLFTHETCIGHVQFKFLNNKYVRDKAQIVAWEYNNDDEVT